MSTGETKHRKGTRVLRSDTGIAPNPDDVETENLRLEYGNAVSLYSTVLSVGYQRMLSLFALQAGLLVGVFSVQLYSHRIVLSIIGLIFGMLTVLTTEHFLQIFRMRFFHCLLYTSPSPRDGLLSRMPSSA